jgi:hypothetical protein
MVFRRFLALPMATKRLYLEAWVRMWVARARLWITRRTRVRKVLGPVLAVPARRASDADASTPVGREVRRLARAVESVSRYVMGGTCLVKALALRDMLARRRRPSGIRLGVAKNGLEIDAHAWVEVPGVGEFGRDGEYLEFVPLESPDQMAAESR